MGSALICYGFRPDLLCFRGVLSNIREKKEIRLGKTVLFRGHRGARRAACGPPRPLHSSSAPRPSAKAGSPPHHRRWACGPRTPGGLRPPGFAGSPRWSFRRRKSGAVLTPGAPQSELNDRTSRSGRSRDTEPRAADGPIRGRCAPVPPQPLKLPQPPAKGRETAKARPPGG